ncbi:MAG: hypothetical protein LBS28_04765 [Streptococcaceae bacterium]|nr:hypothetical protein [Streptococcaceae bacterium]
MNRLKRKCLIKILINVIHSCLEANYLKYVDFFLSIAYSIIQQQRAIEFFNDKLFLDYEYGCYLLMTGDQKEGQKLIKNVIVIFSLSGHDDLDKFQQNYNKIIIKINKAENESKYF